MVPADSKLNTVDSTKGWKTVAIMTLNALLSILFYIR